jgi:hypothetical protein
VIHVHKFEIILLQGMVDPGEMVSITLKREFGEEAMNMLECCEAEKDKIEEKLHTFFKGGREVGELFDLFIKSNPFVDNHGKKPVQLGVP